jgi:hypothetical protein
MRGITLKVIYPLCMFAASFKKNRKEGYQRFVINLNNRFVKQEKPKINNILLLLPHCLQMSECKIRLTYNVYNCERCGKCEIRDLIYIANRNGLKLSIATGGGLARRIISEVRPDAVVAVACENDLSSGIADTYPLPVLGIPNERPYGPCMNTRVDLQKVKEAIEFLGQNSHQEKTLQ